jgi:hypothetical protein
MVIEDVLRQIKKIKNVSLKPYFGNFSMCTAAFKKPHPGKCRIFGGAGEGLG